MNCCRQKGTEMVRRTLASELLIEPNRPFGQPLFMLSIDANHSQILE